MNNLFRTERDKAIRILTSSGINKSDRESKIHAIHQLSKSGAEDELAIRTLILSLDDLQDMGVQDIARTALEDMLKNAQSAAEKEIIMRHLTSFIFDKYYDKTFKSNSLLANVIDTAIKNLPETDDLIAWIMLDAAKGRKVNYTNENLSAELVSFFNRDFLPNNQRSKRAFQDTGYEILLRSLLDPKTASDKFVLETLVRISSQKLENIKFEMVAAHVALPFKLTYPDEKNRKIVTQAIDNISKWSSELVQSPEHILEDYRQISNWLNNDDTILLPISVYQRLALNHLLVEPISRLLRDVNPNLANKSKLFAILSNLQLSRHNQIVSICDYIKKEVKNDIMLKDFPILDSVNFLTSHLVGLNRFMHLTEKEEIAIFGDNDVTINKNRRKITEKSINYATIIINTLLEIIKNKKCTLAAREVALCSIINALPSNLLESIEELRTFLEDEPKLRGLLYKELGNVHFIESLPTLRNVWENNRQKEQQDNNEEVIIKALGKIGTRDILGDFKDFNGIVKADFLLKAAFEEKDNRIQSLIRETLNEAGFSFEVSRESKRQEIIEITAKAEQTAKKIVENESQCQNLILSINENQGKFAENLFLMSSHINNLEMICIDRKLDLLDVGIDIAKLREQLTLLQQRASTLNSEIAKITEGVRFRHSQTQSLNTQLKDISNNLDSAKRKIRDEEGEIRKAETNHRNAESNISKADSQIQSLTTQLTQSNTALRNAESTLKSLKLATQRFENQVRQLRSNPNNEQMLSMIQQAERNFQSAKNQEKEQERQLNQIRNTISKLDGEIKTQERNKQLAQTDLSNSDRRIRQSSSLIQQISGQVTQLESQSQPIPPKIADLQNQVIQYEQDLKIKTHDLELVRREINLLRAQLNKVQAIQKDVQHNFSVESGHENTSISKHKLLAENFERKLFEQKNEFAETEKKLNNNKTEHQNEIQKQEEARRDYDNLGDTCFVETERSHNNHLVQGNNQKLQRIDIDLRSHYLYEVMKHPESANKVSETDKKAINIVIQKLKS